MIKVPADYLSHAAHYSYADFITLIERSPISRYWVLAIRYWFGGLA
ncbi:hypothetical protein D1BOALGB6SA_2773 [Olavius sp. associated proteobacterium Delta 1]|nr:hypothetical protein D1BOALGB6SA_2773 [Olavius sp. associated proteobacterium Delta 1]